MHGADVRTSHDPGAEMNARELIQQKRNWIYAGLLAVAMIILILIINRSGPSSSFPVSSVRAGEFKVSITETGELRATNSVAISAPRVRTNLQIVYLAPKGQEVDEGDTLVVFDGTELQQAIDEKLADLEIARSNLEKSQASMASAMAGLDAQLQTAQASYRQAELRLQQMQFEAEVAREEQQLALLQAEINLERARANIEQQQIIDEAELVTLELRVRQAEADLAKARRDLDQMTMLAPQPGLVVYKEIWKGGDFGEVRIGDTPWRGQALIELPDLSQMEVITSVNEVDVSRVAVGQRADIVLDAFPERKFSGVVNEVSTLARVEDEDVGDVKVFDVVIRVEETDPVLKPGMTVSATIIIETIAEAMWVPLDAIFSVEGQTVVYRQSGGFRSVPVELGIRNDNFVVVTSGLEAGERVSLVDPTKPFDESLWQGSTEEVASEAPNTAVPSGASGNGGGGGRGRRGR